MCSHSPFVSSSIIVFHSCHPLLGCWRRVWGATPRQPWLPPSAPPTTMWRRPSAPSDILPVHLMFFLPRFACVCVILSSRSSCDSVFPVCVILSSRSSHESVWFCLPDLHMNLCDFVFQISTWVFDSVFPIFMWVCVILSSRSSHESVWIVFQIFMWVCVILSFRSLHECVNLSSRSSCECVILSSRSSHESVWFCLSDLYMSVCDSVFYIFMWVCVILSSRSSRESVWFCLPDLHMSVWFCLMLNVDISCKYKDCFFSGTSMMERFSRKDKLFGMWILCVIAIFNYQSHMHGRHDPSWTLWGSMRIPRQRLSEVCALYLCCVGKEIMQMCSVCVCVCVCAGCMSHSTDTWCAVLCVWV